MTDRYQVRPWDDQRQMTFLDRYALRSEAGRVVEPSVDQMLARVAGHVATAPGEAARFLDAMRGFGFVPGGRILSGAHSAGMRSPTLYNCFVIGLRDAAQAAGRDSRAAIMSTITRMVEINARGGGVGINWSALRPSGSYVRGVGGESSGPNCWMRGADAMADQIRQGGTRTGALMFMLNDWHPDILEFARIRERFRRANFSIALSDRFMGALWSGAPWETAFPDTTDPGYDSLWNGDLGMWDGDVVTRDPVPARDLWRDIAQSAWTIGSPGVVFLDRANRLSNTRYMHKPLICTNPCGEQPLPEDGCCNLGSVNLAAFWDDPLGCVDEEALEETTRTATRFMDRVIDASMPVDARIHAEQETCRRIGIGTMGLADLLLLMGVRYGSPGSLGVIRRVLGIVRDAAYSESARLAAESGPAPGYSEEFLDMPFVRELPEEVRGEISDYGIRNLTLLTQAPTGTTGILAGASSGIEPIFARTYTRADATGRHTVVHPLMNGDEDYMVVAREVPPLEHVAVQAEVQSMVDTSVSKTVNLPACAGVDEILRIYLAAYNLGCKGITVYRDGSLENVLTEEGVCPTCSL